MAETVRPNLATLSKIELYHHPTTIGTPVSSFRFNLNKTDAHSGMRFIPSALLEGETYTFSYKFQKTSGTLSKVGGHTGGFTPVKWSFDGISQNTSYSTAISVADDTNTHEVVFTGVYNGSGSDINLYFQPNRGNVTPVSVDIWDVKVELGDTATPWKPAEEDDESLQSAYTKLEYIESTGTQYIDTGLKPTQNTGFEVDFITYDAIDKTGFGSLFGARENSNKRELLLSSYGGFGGKGLLRFGFKSHDALIESGVRLSATLRNGMYSNSLGGELDVTSSEFTSPVNLLLFACNHNGNIMEYGKVRLYSLKFYDGNTLIRDYIPCRNADREIGLWDKVENKFYGNAGGGAFVGGPILFDTTAFLSGLTMGLASKGVPGEEVDAAPVYGVEWDYSQSGTKLTRMDDAAAFANPAPATSLTSIGTSPFDGIMPWSGMKRETIGADEMVYIPKFYYRAEDDKANSKMRWQITSKPKEGFMLHPGSGRYISRYHTSAGYASVSGVMPIGGQTRATFRDNSHAKGNKWWMNDVATWSALQILYLVEFADWDSQTALGRGQTSGSIVETGGTDKAAYHTIKRDAASHQYRWIENPYSNIRDWLDGSVDIRNRVYVSTDNAAFNDTADGYVDTGLTISGTSSGSYITRLSISEDAPWMFIPTATNGSVGTYISDYSITATSTSPTMRVTGGSKSYNGGWGLFKFDSNDPVGFTAADVGSRLIYTQEDPLDPEGMSFSRGYLLGAELRNGRPAEKWETVFEGYLSPVNGSYLGTHYNGKWVCWLHDSEDNYGPNILNDGDIVRITFDGEVVHDTMRAEEYSITCGNEWLFDPKTSDDHADDGTGFTINESSGDLRVMFRDSLDVCQFKVEKKSSVNKPFVMNNPHLYNGYKFPELPARDEAAYPHALLCFDREWPVCIFSSLPLTYDWGDDYENNEALSAQALKFTYRGEMGAFDEIADAGEAWDIAYDVYDGLIIPTPIWSNYDLFDTAGALKLAASDLVPIYK